MDKITMRVRNDRAQAGQLVAHAGSSLSLPLRNTNDEIRDTDCGTAEYAEGRGGNTKPRRPRKPRRRPINHQSKQVTVPRIPLIRDVTPFLRWRSTLRRRTSTLVELERLQSSSYDLSCGMVGTKGGLPYLQCSTEQSLGLLQTVGVL